jgi:hypothetical protein
VNGGAGVGVRHVALACTVFVAALDRFRNQLGPLGVELAGLALQTGDETSDQMFVALLPLRSREQSASDEPARVRVFRTQTSQGCQRLSRFRFDQAPHTFQTDD